MIWSIDHGIRFSLYFEQAKAVCLWNRVEVVKISTRIETIK